MFSKLKNYDLFKLLLVLIATVIIVSVATLLLTQENVDAKYESIRPVLERALVLFTDSNVIISCGEVQTSNTTPFMEKGTVYVPIDEISRVLDASFHFDEITRVSSVELNNHKAQFMLGFNVVIVNTTPIVIRSKPIARDNQVFMPAYTLKNIFNVPVFRDYNQGIIIVGGLKPLNAKDYLMLRKYVGLKTNTYRKVDELEVLNRNFLNQDIYQIARSERLFVSDEAGKLYKWILLDDFTLVKEIQDIDSDFQIKNVFYSGEGKNKDYLFVLGTSDIVFLTPEAQIRNELRVATINYIQMKMACDLFGLSDNMDVIDTMNLYSSIITGRREETRFNKLKDKEFIFSYGDNSGEILNIKKKLNTYFHECIIPLNESFDYYLLEAVFRLQKEQNFGLTGKLDNATYEFITKIDRNDITNTDDIKLKKWNSLCEKAKPGDILVFRNDLRNDQYGYLTHSALILDVSLGSGEIHVLQARSFELNVGSDLPIDYITYAKFYDDSYWESDSAALLLSVRDMTEQTGIEIAQQAVEHFKGYKFGFGGFLGVKETTCVEIIRDSLKLGNITLISDFEYLNRIKSVLDGVEKNLILLPDDIIMSDKIVIVDYFEK